MIDGWYEMKNNISSLLAAIRLSFANDYQAPFQLWTSKTHICGIYCDTSFCWVSRWGKLAMLIISGHHLIYLNCVDYTLVFVFATYKGHACLEQKKNHLQFVTFKKHSSNFITVFLDLKWDLIHRRSRAGWIGWAVALLPENFWAA